MLNTTKWLASLTFCLLLYENSDNLLFIFSSETKVNFHGWLLIDDGLNLIISFSFSTVSSSIFLFGSYFFVVYLFCAIFKKLILCSIFINSIYDKRFANSVP